jgi:hypothetical protein
MKEAGTTTKNQGKVVCMIIYQVTSTLANTSKVKEADEVGCTTLHCLRSTKESGSTIGGRAKALSSTLKEKFALASSELTTWKAK